MFALRYCMTAFSILADSGGCGGSYSTGYGGPRKPDEIYPRAALNMVFCSGICGFGGLTLLLLSYYFKL
jgi:hypothetical protein